MSRKRVPEFGPLCREGRLTKRGLVQWDETVGVSVMRRNMTNTRYKIYLSWYWWLMTYAFYILLSCVMHHFEHKVDKCIHSTANLFMQDTQKHDTPTPKKEIKYFWLNSEMVIRWQFWISMNRKLGCDQNISPSCYDVYISSLLLGWFMSLDSTYLALTQ